MIKGKDQNGRKTAVLTLPFTAVSHASADTEAIGAALGRYLLAEQRTDAFLALYGDLGAGKTAFVRGLASVVTPDAHVCSPTYTIVNEYRSHGRTLCHLDLYRIEDEDDLYSTGFYDYMDGNSVLFIEWSENIEYALPDERITVSITKTESGRTIEVSGLEGR